MRALFLALLIILSAASAQAFPFRVGSASSSTSCVFLGNTTNLSCVLLSDSTDFLTNVAVGHSTQYAAGGAGPLNFYLTSSPSGSPWVQFGGTNKAVLCTGAGQINAQTTGITGYANPWWQADDTGGTLQTWYQVPTSCGGLVSTFVNTATSATYHGMADMCSAASSGNSLSVPVQPSGIPYWDGSFYGHEGGCEFLVSGVTLNVASGTLLYNPFSALENGTGGITFKADSDILSCPGVTIGLWNGNDQIIYMYPGLGTNATVEGASGNPCIIDQGPNTGSHCILSGGHVGLVTLANLVIQNCGFGSGLQHLIYLSWGGDPTNDPTYCHAVTGVVARNNFGGGPAVKFDDQCEDGQSTATALGVYCTNLSYCAASEAYDQQCGGNQLVSTSLLEYYGVEAAGDAGILSKVGWGALWGGGCPQYPTSGTNAIVYNNSTFIFDGFNDSPSYFHTHPIAVCASAYDGNDCASGAGPVSTSSTTSLTVETGYIAPVIGTGLSVGGGTPLNLVNGSNSMSSVIVQGCNSGTSCNFTGSISGTALTITAISPSSCSPGGFDYTCPISIGQTIAGSGITANTVIISGGVSGGCTIPNLPCTFTVNNSQSASSETMTASPYNSSTGQTAMFAYTHSGSGTFSSWTVASPNHIAACVKNSVMIEDDSNYSSGTEFFEGNGVDTDSGCATTATNTNTFYAGQTGTTAAGRRNACKVLSQIAGSGWSACNTPPNVLGAWPYVPDYTQAPPTQATQTAEAITLGCSGSGTSASPITACP